MIWQLPNSKELQNWYLKIIKLICELAQLYQDNDQLIKATEFYVKLGKIKIRSLYPGNFLAYRKMHLFV